MVITTSHKPGSMSSPFHANYYMASSHCSVKEENIYQIQTLTKCNARRYRRDIASYTANTVSQLLGQMNLIHNCAKTDPSCTIFTDIIFIL